MKKILFLFLIIGFISFGQNKVINPSFETFNHSLLPGGVYPPAPGRYYLSTYTSYLPPPYTERNTTDPVVTVPPSYNYARTGIVSVGLAATANNRVYNNPYREYIIGKTTNLIAGTQYKVEFWAKRDGGNTDIRLGAYMSTTGTPCTSGFCPNLNYLTPTVEGTVLKNNFQYTKVVGFWTPSTSGIFYITIGNFKLTSVEGSESNYFFIDDISVSPCATGTGNPNPILTIQKNAYCLNDQITVSAATSTNVDEYRWKLYEQGVTAPIKLGQWIPGLPTLLDVNAFYNGLKEGKCYNLELEAVDKCKFKTVSVNFCIEDPNITVVPINSPVCEGSPVTLQVIGDSRWTYSWSNGFSGVGLTSTVVTANLSTSNYTVDVLTSARCRSTANIDLTVHPINNIPPYVNGINNSGEYTAYVKAGDNICFDIPSFDNISELVSISWDNSISGANFNRTGSPHETGRFCWSPSAGDIGHHSFKVTVKDNNACGSKQTEYIFKVKVVCEYCPLSIYYVNRSQSTVPMPAVTEAGEKIVAGEAVDPRQINGPVYNASGTSVEFRAPKIFLHPGFTGKHGFHGIADDSTCTETCEDCCENWTGFTYDFIPNVFSPNGDGVNDVWYLPDVDNPYCAFNAKEFDLRIYNRWGTTIKHLSYSGGECCPFQAPSPDNPIGFSSIYWDGRTNGGRLVSDGAYAYTLILRGCEDEIHHAGYIRVFGTNSRASSHSNTTIVKTSTQEVVYYSDPPLDFEKIGNITYRGVNKEVVFKSSQEPQVYPNPTSDIIYINLVHDINVIQLLSTEGKLLLTQNTSSKKTKISLANYVSGTYLIRVTNAHGVHVKKVIKN